jgi:ATP-dependent exoDNAse (exonuclease V) alpha subunit
MNVGYDSIDSYYKYKLRTLKKKINNSVDYDIKSLKLVVRKQKNRIYKIDNNDIRGLYQLPNNIFNNLTDVVDDKEINFEDLVNKIIESKHSYSINGRAGTGKSTLSNMLVEKLRKMGKNVITLAPTNKAALIVKGQTNHKFIGSYFEDKKTLIEKMKDIHYILIDEISMMKELHYKVFLTIKKMFKHVKFILVGDFGQLKPVNDRVGLYADYKNSPVYHELCDNNNLTLLKCRRADDTLFNLCKPENISNIDVKQFGNKLTFKNLSFTNYKRIEVNDKCMKEFIKKKETKQGSTNCITKISLNKTSNPNSQDITICAGMPVISYVNDKKFGIVNNQTFVINQIIKKNKINLSDLKNRDDMINYINLNKNIVDKKTMKKLDTLNKDELKKIIKDINKITVDNFVEIIEDDGDKNIILIPIEKFQSLFFLAFCITVHRSQGCTFDKSYTIHEWNKYNDEMKYVALSRSTDIKYINIFDN